MLLSWRKLVVVRLSLLSSTRVEYSNTKADGQEANVGAPNRVTHIEDRSFTFKVKCSNFLRNSADYRGITIPGHAARKSTTDETSNSIDNYIESVHKAKLDNLKATPKTIHLKDKQNAATKLSWKVLKSNSQLLPNLFPIPKTIEMIAETQLNDSASFNKEEKAHILDRAVAPLLEKCNSQEALQLSFAVLEFSGRHFHRTLFFHSLLLKASGWFQNCSDPRELVVWTFILSEGKRNKEKGAYEADKLLGQIYHRFKSCVPLFERLCSTELSIICNAFFTANIVIDSRTMLDVVERLLKQEIDSNPGTITADALPMLKVLRKAGHATDELLSSVTNSLISPSASKLNLGQATHALALLADHRCPADQKLISTIAQMIRTNNTDRPVQLTPHPTRGTRTKEVTRLMWVLSCIVNEPSSERDKIAESLIQQVDEAWKKGFFNRNKHEDYHLLSDFFLSLACWRLYPQILIESIINRKFVDAVIGRNGSFRLSRLALFLVAARIEAPHLKLDDSLMTDIVNSVPPFLVNQELKRRPRLGQLTKTIILNKTLLECEDIQCCSSVPHLNIGGVTFIYKGRKISVELLDPSVCMRWSETPDRLLALKIRLSEQLGYQVIQVSVPQSASQKKGYEHWNQQIVSTIKDCFDKTNVKF